MSEASWVCRLSGLLWTPTRKLPPRVGAAAATVGATVGAGGAVVGAAAGLAGAAVGFAASWAAAVGFCGAAGAWAACGAHAVSTASVLIPSAPRRNARRL